MIRGCVLFAVFHTISAQGQFPVGPPPNIPKQCLAPPPVAEQPYDCCPIPPFFTDKDFSECGFTKVSGSELNEPRGPPNCEKQLCILKKNELLDDDDNLDEESIKEFMDEWAEKNQEFKAVIAITKEKCIGKDLPGPPQICDANKMVFCVSSTLLEKCPVWKESEGCTKLRTHMEECRPPFPQ